MKTGNILIYLNKLYKGNWNEIYAFINRKEKIKDDRGVEDAVSSLKHPYLTILDEKYPEKLKFGYKPPFCLFYEGNLDLLNENNIIAISRCRLNDLKNKKIFKEISNDFILMSGYENKADEETLSFFVKQGKKFILVLSSSLDDIDPDDPIIHYALHNDCLIITEHGFESEETNEDIALKQRIIATFVSYLFVVSSEKTDLKTNLLIDGVLGKDGDIYCVPESPFKNSLNNQLIQDGAILVDSYLDIKPGIKR